MEPEWEAKFEPNSYGFRPGRNCHDALREIKNAIDSKPKYVIDADIAKCFDKINHQYLLDKIGMKGKYRNQLKYWLEAGVLDSEVFSETTEGTPQEGVISPLLANIALHGMEEYLKNCFPDIRIYWGTGKKVDKNRYPDTLTVVRYADDFVVIHDNLEVILRCMERIKAFLVPIGLELSEAKTRLTHTLRLLDSDTVELGFDGVIGFDFLGYTFKQFPTIHRSAKSTIGKKLGFKTQIFPSKKSVKKHQEKLHEIVLRKGKGMSQDFLIRKLNPIIRGWSNYFGKFNSSTSGILGKQDYLLYLKLRRWAKRVLKGKAGPALTRFWSRLGNRKWAFIYKDKKNPSKEPLVLLQHIDYSKPFYIKMIGTHSPYDNEQIYWATRLTDNTIYPKRVTKLLKLQRGKCASCKLQFSGDDVWEVDHIKPLSQDGKDHYNNLQLLHRHCHHNKSKVDMENLRKTAVILRSW
jgi:RNA-directed DNA polymerase